MSTNNELTKLMVKVDNIINNTNPDEQEYSNGSFGYHNFNDGNYPVAAYTDGAHDIFSLSKNEIYDSVKMFNTALDMFGDRDDCKYSDAIIGTIINSIYNTMDTQLVQLNNELYYRIVPIMCNKLNDLASKRLGISFTIICTRLLTEIDESVMFDSWGPVSILSRITGVNLEKSKSMIDQFYFDNDKEFEIDEDNVLRILSDLSVCSSIANYMSLRLYNFITSELYKTTFQYFGYNSKEFTDSVLEDFYKEAYSIIQDAVISIHDSYLDHLKMVLMSTANKFPYISDYVDYHKNRLYKSSDIDI